MAPDIKARVATDFGSAEQQEVLRLLKTVEKLRFDSNRVLRGLLYLANGEMARLVQFVDCALKDPRDVIYDAEYDEQDRRLRDFSRPFPKSSN